MADSFQEKTEQATPKKLAEARSKGNVPKSQEFNSVAILFAGLVTLYFLSDSLLSELQATFKTFYQEVGQTSVNGNNVRVYLGAGLQTGAALVTPFMIVLAVVGAAVNIAQVGFLFTLKPLVPDFKKLNPISGFKKFVSPKSFAELVKGIFKLFIVGGISYWTLMEQQDSYMLLIYQGVGGIMKFLGTVLFQVAMRTTAALLLLAILDLIYQRWQFKKDSMMTKQEVKDEQKQAEGDPLVKSAIRSLQQSRSRERMMDNVPGADVIVTNPTHYAVALKYDVEEMGAPVVVAKGARLLARRIKEIAAKHDIPIIENKPLAQSLYKLCGIGKEIPFELFQAVAEVFAFVYQMKTGKV